MNQDLGVWTDQDCALVLIDYQKEIFATIARKRAPTWWSSFRLLARTARRVNMPIVLSTVGVAAGIQWADASGDLSELPGLQVIDRRR